MNSLLSAQLGGNAAFGTFSAEYGVPEGLDIRQKYDNDVRLSSMHILLGELTVETQVAACYRSKLSAISQGREWQPPTEKPLPPAPLVRDHSLFT